MTETRKYQISREDGIELVKNTNNETIEKRNVKIKESLMIHETLHFMTENEYIIPWYNLEFTTIKKSNNKTKSSSKSKNEDEKSSD